MNNQVFQAIKQMKRRFWPFQLKFHLLKHDTSSGGQDAPSGKGSNFHNIDAWRKVKDKGNQCKVDGLTLWR